MGVVVKRPGVSTTIQDLGRMGHLASGFSPNGVMDRRAAIVGNILVENPWNTGVLEFAMAGPTLRFTTDAVVALTGADFRPTLNGTPIPCEQAVKVPKGSVLALANAAGGMFGYLAVAGGGFRVEPVMGSVSTNLKCGLGGWHGRALAYGDYIPFTARVDFLPNLGSHSTAGHEAPPSCGGIGAGDAAGAGADTASDAVVVRVVPGPQEDMFTPEGLATFYGNAFKTTAKCDRMGYRLDGPAIATKAGSDIISDGIAFGAVQVPSHGRPIVMLADRQTTGGYAKIGTVASVDIPLLVQCPPGTPLRFARVSVQQAQALLCEEHAWFKALERAVRRPAPGGESPRRAARRITAMLAAEAAALEGEPNWLVQRASLKQQARKAWRSAAQPAGGKAKE